MKINLTVKTAETFDGNFVTSYYMSQELTKTYTHHYEGKVKIYLAAYFEDDRAILAELSAIDFILHGTPFAEESLTGNNLNLNVSFGAIKKALRKGKLKSENRGATEKVHVASFAQFLATKYFAADVHVSKGEAIAPQSVESEIKDFIIEVASAPEASVFSPAVGRTIKVSRHAIRRMVERVSGRKAVAIAESMEDVPDDVWTDAWRQLRGTLASEKTVELVGINDGEKEERCIRVHGAAPRVLYNVARRLAMILMPTNGNGLCVSTIIQIRDGDRYDRAYRNKETSLSVQNARKELFNESVDNSMDSALKAA